MKYEPQRIEERLDWSHLAPSDTIWHFQYFIYPEGYDRIADWKVPVDLKLTQTCATYHRHRREKDMRHRATCHTEYVTCTRCKVLPEFQKKLKQEAMEALNKSDL